MAGGSRPSFSRALARLNTPVAYLATLGGLQVGLLWVFRGHLGFVLPLIAAAGWLALLALLLLTRGRWAVKQALLYGLIAASALGPTLLEILQRPRLGISIEHDGLVQTEAAIDRLLHGQPIYGHNWSNTALAQMPWSFPSLPNPALHHLAYFPLTVLAGVPVRAITDWLGIPFDGRIVLLLMSLLALAALAALPIAAERRFMIATAVFMSPLITLFLWSGRNDVEFLAFVFLSLALLTRNRPVGASAALGIAMAFKPFAIFAAPFLLLALYDRWRQGGSPHVVLLSLLALAAAPVLTIAPFLYANPHAFLTDTIAYTSGGVPDAYPIGGYGFGAFVLALHLVPSNTAAFPFALFQLPAMLMTLWVFGRRFLGRPTLARWMSGYAALFSAFAFFARFFNDSYVGVVLTLALCSPPLGDTEVNASPPERARELAA
ncbi:MAG: hypothetical protein M3077_09130 [Candidatus Dormibacteraeota bacterium]|nr:hypothetical protein [Candidatus Dormibacteraeota bacterium]